MVEKNPQINNKFSKGKHEYLFYTWYGKAFMGTVVNWTYATIAKEGDLSII